MAIQHGNEPVFDLLMGAGVDLEVKTGEGYPPLFYALQQSAFTGPEFAAKLVEKGASTATVSPEIRTHFVKFFTPTLAGSHRVTYRTQYPVVWGLP